MKIYCSEINLAKPNNIQIWVSKNSDYGIGISVIKDGEKIDAKLFDGDTEIQSSNSLDKYTVFNMKSANKTETKNLTVKAGNQEINLFVNTTDSDCAEVTPPMPEAGLNEEGVKELLTSGNVENISATEITTSMVNASSSITTPAIAASESVDAGYVNVWNDVKVGNQVEASQFNGYYFSPPYTATEGIMNNAPTMTYQESWDGAGKALYGVMVGEWQVDHLSANFDVQAYDLKVGNALKFTDNDTGEDVILTVSDIKQLLQLINQGA